MTEHLETSTAELAELAASPPPECVVLQSAMLIDMSFVLLGVIMLTVSNGTTEQVTPLAPQSEGAGSWGVQSHL